MVSKKVIYVRKMDGRTELYNPFKLKRSLRKAGAGKETIRLIMSEVEKILHNGIETKELFNFIFRELNEREKESATKYNLKNAIIDLRLEGGYVFEKFMGRVFEKKGYNVKLNQLMKGKLITHEIDVSAFKGSEKLMVECKHHSKPWLGTRVDTALYVYARFLDLKDSFNKAALVTNTKFSSQVIRYGRGVGMKLMGWNYPKGDSLQENIEKFKLYPITILNLPKTEINDYIARNILTVEELRKIKPKVVEKNIS